MVDDPNRTVHAQQAFDFADVFGYKFQALIFGQQRPRRLKLNQPDGPSTAGGRQARQSMVLVAEDGENVVCGFVDVPAKSAELRSYQAVASQFEARHHRALDLEKSEYERMLAELEGFLKIQQIEVKIAASAPVPKPRATPEPAPAEPEDEMPNQMGMMMGMLGLGMLIGFALGYLAFGL